VRNLVQSRVSSPRRNISQPQDQHGVARIKLGLQEKLYLGNPSASRDWGYAADYVKAMWLMLQQEVPDNFVIGTGETHSVEEFVHEAFSYAGLEWKEYVVIDPRY
jgi:GDPmannose 4,6-dehydratase